MSDGTVSGVSSWEWSEVRGEIRFQQGEETQPYMRRPAGRVRLPLRSPPTEVFPTQARVESPRWWESRGLVGFVASFVAGVLAGAVCF